MCLFRCVDVPPPMSSIFRYVLDYCRNTCGFAASPAYGCSPEAFPATVRRMLCNWLRPDKKTPTVASHRFSSVSRMHMAFVRGRCSTRSLRTRGQEALTYKQIYRSDLGGAKVALGESRKLNLRATHNAGVCVNAFGRNPRLPILDEDIA